MENKDNYLYKLRHSLAHVMAQAVLELRPQSKLAFGPPIDTGCYYDFDFDQPLSSEDFPEIEKRMRRIIKEKQEFLAAKRSGPEALKYLEQAGEKFKREYCEELISQGEKEIGFYRNGPFEDMCAGPHLKHTGEIPLDAFKIDSLAGAYWRGSEKNPQLTRIYCLAFATKDELKEFIRRREDARARDHRKLGKELDLFIIEEDVGPGLPLWTPNGTVIREELENFAKETEDRYGYQRVATPHIAKDSLFYTSGHLPYYKEDMFPPMHLEGEADYYLKAMNCPHHHLIFGHRPRSYRELPFRMAEYGTVYRYESSGALSGLMRVRSLAMNDAHIYCMPEQVRDEVKDSIEMTVGYYKKFRFEGIKLRLSTRDESKPEKFVDNPEGWNESEKVLQEVLEESGMEYDIGAGEAAFYGPKIDFQAHSLLGKEETISTCQLDFHQPARFGLKYTAEDGRERVPYVIHRAPLSTHERFIGFLIEHFAGAFPTWMAPKQIRIIPVAGTFLEYAKKIERALREDLIRVEIDDSSSSFNKKIREATVSKIPNVAIVGGKEVENNTLTLRFYGKKEQKTLPADAAVARLKEIISNREMDNFPDHVF